MNKNDEKRVKIYTFEKNVHLIQWPYINFILWYFYIESTERAKHIKAYTHAHMIAYEYVYFKMVRIVRSAISVYVCPLDEMTDKYIHTIFNTIIIIIISASVAILMRFDFYIHIEYRYALH